MTSQSLSLLGARRREKIGPETVLASEHYVRLRNYVIDHVDPEEALQMSLEGLKDTLSEVIAGATNRLGLFLNGYEQRKLVDEMADDMVRLGPIQPLIEDPEISDILVNGPDQVLIERHGLLEPTRYRFRDENHLMNLAQRIAAAVGRRIDESSPMVDARLADGSRVNIIGPPLSLSGVCVSIRKFTREILDLDQMAGMGCLSPAMADFLRMAAKARLNILISGGTGAGKTTLLNALSQHIGREERIITIEDAAELRLDQPYVIKLETRSANVEGMGEVTQRDLVRNTLRMRPDRIIVGEVRGAEALDMLQAMNTGHDGSLSTVHANNPDDALLRLENMLNMGATYMSSELVRRQLATALDLIIQIERDPGGARRVVDICEVCPDMTVGVRCRGIFRYTRSESSGEFVKVDRPISLDQKIFTSGLSAQFKELFGEPH
ncbi:MAG: CpaF family protein [Deltaproteobacteria bacterium]|jgi:pilus assembly protein CpaF|nr:CpaF family protein [Deltaproteobacteria bacterium]